MSDRPSPALPARRRLLSAVAAAGAVSALPGCAFPAREAAVPRGLAGRATVLGLRNERFRPMENGDNERLEAEFTAAFERQRRHQGRPTTADPTQLNLLAISGGGENGAFGAGLLNGWTRRGDRPSFDLVTGVSTGALSAPFAFVGPSRDAELKSVYTDISLDKVARRRWFTAALFDDAMADSAPLFELISSYLDDRMLADIARGYEDGRLLLVATADIDAQMPVIWNIGAIAASGHPRAQETIRRILLASAAIPGAFPPVMFDVTVDGQRHQEMHVDGGAFTQVFLYPSSVTQQRRAVARAARFVPARAWVIRNGRLDPEWAATDRRTVSIAGRAVSTMIAASGYNDVVRTYFVTQRDGVDFNLAFIGRDFTMDYTEPFEPAYMRALFDYAYARAERGYDWMRIPPS